MSQRVALAAVAAAAVIGAAPGAAQDISGTWHISLERDRGVATQTLVLVQEGSFLTGTVRFEPDAAPGDGGDGTPRPIPLSDGVVLGSSFTFTITLETGADIVQQLYAGTFEGDTMRGLMEGGRGDGERFTGTRGG